MSTSAEILSQQSALGQCLPAPLYFLYDSNSEPMGKKKKKAQQALKSIT